MEEFSLVQPDEDWPLGLLRVGTASSRGGRRVKQRSPQLLLLQQLSRPVSIGAVCVAIPSRHPLTGQPDEHWGCLGQAWPSQLECYLMLIQTAGQWALADHTMLQLAHCNICDFAGAARWILEWLRAATAWNSRSRDMKHGCPPMLTPAMIEALA